MSGDYGDKRKDKGEKILKKKDKFSMIFFAKDAEI